MKAILRTTKVFKDWVLNLSPKARTQLGKNYDGNQPTVNGFVIEPTLTGSQRSNGTQNMDKSDITYLDQIRYKEEEETYAKQAIDDNQKQKHGKPGQSKNGEDCQQHQKQKGCIDKLELKNYFPQWEWYSKQTKLAKGTIVSAIILCIGVIVGLISWLATRCWTNCQPEYPEGLIVYQNQEFLLTQATHTDLNHDSMIILAQTKKAQSIDRSTESVLRTLWTSDNLQKWIFSVRIFAILENLSNSQKNQQIYKDWLEEYNKNPRKMIDLLVATIKQTLVKPGTQKWGKKIPDNITLQSVIEQTLIDIRYDPFLEKFVLSTFQENALEIIDFNEGKDRIYYKKEKENLRSQNKTAETSDKKGKKSDKNELANENNQTRSKQQLLAKVMQETVYYIKRVAARNIEAIRAQSVKLMEYQKSIIDENRQLQKWEKTLIEDCKSIEMLKFRCKIEGAMELIPGLTMEKLMEPGSTYLISENLEMVFKEVKVEQKGQGNQ